MKSRYLILLFLQIFLSAVYHADSLSAPYAPGGGISNPTLSLSDPSSGDTSYTNETNITATIGNDASAAYWILSETQNTQPAVSDLNWQATKPAAYTFNSATNETKTIYVWVKDLSGNINTGPISAVITLDTVAPSNGTVIINNDDAYATSNVITLLLNSSGADSMMISNVSDFSDGASWETYSSNKTFTIAGTDGTKTVYAKFKDNAGNISESAVSDSIVLDTIASAGTMTINSGSDYTNSRVVTLLLNAAGFDSMMISNVSDFSDGASWETYSSNKTFTITGTDGTKTVYAKFKDNAGHISESSISDNIILDTEPPTSQAITINNDNVNTATQDVTLNLSATGASQMMLSENNLFTSAEWEAYGTSKAFRLSDGYGVKTVYAKFKDLAGNESTTANDSITFASGEIIIPPEIPPEVPPVVPPIEPPITPEPGTIVDEPKEPQPKEPEKETPAPKEEPVTQPPSEKAQEKAQTVPAEQPNPVQQAQPPVSTTGKVAPASGSIRLKEEDELGTRTIVTVIEGRVAVFDKNKTEINTEARLANIESIIMPYELVKIKINDAYATAYIPSSTISEQLEKSQIKTNIPVYVMPVKRYKLEAEYDVIGMGILVAAGEEYSEDVVSKIDEVSINKFKSEREILSETVLTHQENAIRIQKTGNDAKIEGLIRELEKITSKTETESKIKLAIKSNIKFIYLFVLIMLALMLVALVINKKK